MDKRRLLVRLFLLFASFSSSIEVGASRWEIEKDDESASNHLVTDSSAKAVCYIDDTYYLSLDAALNAAYSNNKSDVIYVIPNLGEAVSITGSKILESGDTLNLPYDGETVFVEPSVTHGNLTGEIYFADQNADLVATYRKTQVVLNGGATLIVNGELNIGGVLGNATQPVAGQTAGEYCEITMEAGSKLTCDGGTINCYGYIKRASVDADPLLTIQNSGTLQTPFVMYDFKGGNFTLAAVNLSTDKLCPFQVFDFCNVQVKTKVFAGSYWVSRTCVYVMSNFTSMKDLYFVGVESDDNASALILKEGYITVDYEPIANDFPYTKVTKSGNVAKNESRTHICVFGDVDIGNIYVETYSIDTAEFFFPISYKFSFEICSGSTLNVAKKVKFMNGSSLTVDAGATANLTSSLIVYDDYEDDGSGNPSPYPSDMGEATFVNNGTVNVSCAFDSDGNITSYGAIGGYIDTSSEGALLNYDSNQYSVSSPEVGSWTKTGDYTGVIATELHTETARGLLTTDSENFAEGNITKTDYDSVLYNGTYGWHYEKTITVTEGTALQDGECGSIKLKADSDIGDSSTLLYEWELIDNTNSDITLVEDSGSSDTAIVKNTSTSAITVNVKTTETSTGMSVENSFEVPGRQWEIEDLDFNVTENGNTITGEPDEKYISYYSGSTYAATTTENPKEFDLSVNIAKPVNFNTGNTVFWWRFTVSSGVSNVSVIADNTAKTKGTSFSTTLDDHITIKFTGYKSGSKTNTALISISFLAITTNGEDEKQLYPDGSSLGTNNSIKSGYTLKFTLCTKTEFANKTKM